MKFCVSMFMAFVAVVALSVVRVDAGHTVRTRTRHSSCGGVARSAVHHHGRSRSCSGSVAGFSAAPCPNGCPRP